MNNDEIKLGKDQLYSGIIWIISAMALALYGIILLFNSHIPGVKELVDFLSEIDNKYVYLVAFLSIFIEGLYFIGNFFPGASLVLLVTIISGINGIIVFCVTLLFIFVGWSLAGAVNIYMAKTYRRKIIKAEHSKDYHVNSPLTKDRALGTRPGK